jgi:hypothetical protein
MDLQTIILGIVAVSVLVLPFVLMGLGGKKQEKRMVNALKGMAGKQDCTIAEYDASAEFAIGLANNNQYLYYCKKRGEIQSEQYISLKEVAKCKVNEERRNAGTKKEPESVLERLELVFTSKSDSAKEQRIEFYRTGEAYQLSGELQLIRKWEARINKALQTQ